MRNLWTKSDVISTRTRYEERARVRFKYIVSTGARHPTSEFPATLVTSIFGNSSEWTEIDLPDKTFIYTKTPEITSQGSKFPKL